MAHSRETGVSWKPELPTAAQHPTRGGAAPRQEGGMTSVLFTNVRIFDGTGALAYPGEVLVQGNRISRIARGARALPTAGVTTVDGGGATLMPGLVEAHTHFSWNDQPGLSEIQRMPTEEHILWCAHIAKRYLDMGFTSCIGAATAKPRLDVVIRNAIESGQNSGSAVPGGEPGDHGAGRPGRRDAAAPAVSRVQFRGHRQRPRGDAEDGAHVPQVRGGHRQAEPLGGSTSRGSRPSSRR